MKKAKTGDSVRVHYTGKLENGEVFASTKNSPPLELAIGSNSIIPALERSIVGMEVGDEREVKVLPEEAFGLRREELVVQVRKSDFPQITEPSVGQQLQFKHPDGDFINVVITDMNQQTITMDANHPLAGETLFFDVELVDIL
jgi:peptidylprolyl isomerase